MSVVLLIIAGGLFITVLAGVFALALGRAATRGELQRAAASVEERRLGLPDRRATGRPWETEAPGRRREDVLRAELAEARQRLEEAEDRLAEAELRRATGDG